MRAVLRCLSLASALTFLVALVSGASAKTTVYTDSSVSPVWANPTDVNQSVGGADGAFAGIPNGGWIAYTTGPDFFDELRTQVTITGVTGSGSTRIYVGRTNGSGWFSALNSQTVSIANGVNEFSTPGLTSYCVGIGGCDVFILQPIGGTSLQVDRVLARTPEPGAWALMLLAFAGLGFRMKSIKRNERVVGASLARA